MQARKPFVIGFLGHICIVGAILILLYASTFKEATDFLLTALIFLIVGLFMAFVTVGIKFQPFNIKETLQTFMWTGMNFGAIIVLNKYVPFRVEMSIPLSDRYFGVLMGVAEECFFRVWLCGMIYRMGIGGKYRDITAIGTSSLIWSVYHISRYGGNFNILLLIFLCGCVLGASFIYSRNADGCILAHGAVNYIAIP